MSIWLRSVGTAIGAFVVYTSAAQAQPWQEPNDPAMAINEPFQYAWRLFIALNWPADTSCKADANKKLGDAGTTVWESWRSREQTYLQNAQKPGTWETTCEPTVVAQNKTLTPVAQELASASAVTMPSFVPPAPGEALSTQATEEVRLNRTAYEFIIDQKLFSRNEQTARARLALAARQQGKPLPEKAIIKFPINAKEAKGHWVLIRDEDKPRYHWSPGKFDGKDVAYGLVALSFTTKDLPNWFWVTFEHVDNQSEWPGLKKKWPDFIASDAQLVARLNKRVQDWFATWEMKSVDRFACPTAPHDCNDFPKGIGLEATKWQHYRLRGIQTDFVDSQGAPSLLVNSKIEGNFEQQHMSCITCHALAAVNASGGGMPIFILEKNGPNRKDRIGFVGAPKTDLFKNDTIQLDFVWSLRQAQCDPADTRPCQGPP